MSEYKKRTKADVKSKEPFTYGTKTKSGKPAKHGTTVEFKDGTKTVLLNPSGKGAKYSFELQTGTKITNGGDFKTKNGKEIELTKEQRAYRAGYLDSQSDNAKAYKAKQAKRYSKNQ